jgi:D-alanyl-D-alanine carboxypeptidase/D-alanyl-D-alanine-endopeptidase (penicillin-binding protein 4)
MQDSLFKARGRGIGWLLLAAALLAAPVRAQETRLGQAITALLLRLGPHAITAVRVVSLDRGEVLYERNADLSLNPASNMKLLTSATALAKLGPEYRFTTRVLASARPDADGTVAGDLALQGGGDPVLETEGLQKLADGVKAAGIRKVTGSLKVDDYRFDTERLGAGWNWDDEPFSYSAQISALAVNRNVLHVDVSPGGAPGDPPVVRVRPLEGYARVVVDAATGERGSGTEIRIGRERARNEIRVSGSIAVDAAPLKAREVTMEEPELLAGALFLKLLSERGVQVGSSVARAPASRDAVLVAALQSPPLKGIVALENKPSDNLIAETLLKELGYACKKSGTAESGGQVVEGWLKELGIDTGGLRVSDGSGLGRRNLVTARLMSDLLAKADRQPWREAFINSLPVAGVDGTLRSRMKDSLAERNVRAKTGTISRVSALSGYVTTAGGERLAFSILLNNFPGPTSGSDGAKRVEDGIAVALAAWRGPSESRVR